MNPFCIPFAITNMGGALAAMDIGFMVRPCRVFAPCCRQS
jgi:hypothetical protein